METRILKATMQPPTDGTTHWSTRRLARNLGINHMQVARAWAKAGLQPHRMQRYVASNDPDFETRRTSLHGRPDHEPAAGRRSHWAKWRYAHWVQPAECRVLSTRPEGPSKSGSIALNVDGRGIGAMP